jgi:hypothetical protein
MYTCTHVHTHTHTHIHTHTGKFLSGTGMGQSLQMLLVECEGTSCSSSKWTMAISLGPATITPPHAVARWLIAATNTRALEVAFEITYTSAQGCHGNTSIHSCQSMQACAADSLRTNVTRWLCPLTSLTCRNCAHHPC